MGKKILVLCFDVYNDRPFLEKYTAKDHISNTKLEKGDHYHWPLHVKNCSPGPLGGFNS